MVVMTVMEKSRDPAYDHRSVKSSYLPSQPFLFVATYTYIPVTTERSIISSQQLASKAESNLYSVLKSNTAEVVSSSAVLEWACVTLSDLAKFQRHGASRVLSATAELLIAPASCFWSPVFVCLVVRLALSLSSWKSQNRSKMLMYHSYKFRSNWAEIKKLPYTACQCSGNIIASGC